MTAAAWLAVTAAGAVAATVALALGALASVGPGGAYDFAWADARVGRIVVFTVAQAGLSTLLAVVPGIAVARSLARRRFPGRTLVLRLFGLPIVVPVVVAVFGIVAVYGRNGWLNDGLASVGLPASPVLYGLPGILLAHVFFNLPLTARLLLTAWAAIPAENWRLASELGLSSGQVFRFVEWPALRSVLPGAATLVFFLCFMSFGVVLTLGGGPRATILEVAIYQALRLDFDLGRAVALALVQLVLCGAIAALLGSTRRIAPFGVSLDRPWPRPDTAGVTGRVVDAVVLAAAVVVVAAPLAATVARAADGPLARVLGEADLWAAVGRSLALGALGGALATLLGGAIALGARDLRTVGRRRTATTAEAIGSSILVVSPLVLGAGLFVLTLPLGGSPFVALALVVLLGGLMSLPYAIHLIGGRLARSAVEQERLCAALGIAGWHRLRLVDLPALRRPAGLALALATALGAGDLGAIALFGTQETETLALRLYRQLAGYRLDEAAVTALVHLGLVVGLFVVIERWVGGRERG